MISEPVIVTKVWRSELPTIILFIITLAVSSVLSTKYPATVIRGLLFSAFDVKIVLTLPLLWLVPFVVFVIGFSRIYNSRYILGPNGIEAREGIIALTQTVTLIRYEDIRSIETDQSILGRILDIGDVEIGTAATSMLEVRLVGVSEPKKLQQIIQHERDLRQKAKRPSKAKKEAISDGELEVVAAEAQELEIAG